MILAPSVNSQLTTEEKYRTFRQRPVYKINNAVQPIWVARNISGSISSQAVTAPVQSKEELNLLYEQIKPELHPCIGAIVDDLDWSLVLNYARKKKIEDAQLEAKPKEEIIELLDLYSVIQLGGKRTLHQSAVLCFHRAPEQFYPSVRSVFVKSADTNQSNQAFTRIDVRGPLGRQLSELLQQVMEYSKPISYIGADGHRIDTFDIDENVVREAISNALAHRRYDDDTMHVKVEVTDTYVSVQSPGEFPSGCTWDLLLNSVSRISWPVNAAIAKYLSDVAIVEGIGRGFDIFRAHIERYGADAVTCNSPVPGIVEVKIARQPKITSAHAAESADSGIIGLRTAPQPEIVKSRFLPLQKPLRTQHFTDRVEELTRLLADLQPGRVVTLSGPGGIGKSALAAEAVWTLAPSDEPPARFPDGILFHTFYHQPQADMALETLARAYGVDPRPSPRDAARLALANRKALLVLDGAEAADDLSAVLSVAGSCGVLITTRRHADAPAAIQEIEPLPRGEGLQLLRAWAGKYAADDGAANEIVRLLGGLPLALFMVGRYLSQRRQAAGKYVQWLEEEGLEALHFGERPSRSVPLLLARSLEQVSEAAQAAFGVAGVFALAPFTAEAVAAALQISTPAAHRALGELVDYGLLLRPAARYQITHALAHSYARTQAAPDGEAIGRLAFYYAALAEAESGRGLAGFAVLDGERAHILAVQTAALGAEQWDAVRQITWQVDGYLDLKGYWTDRISVIEAGLHAARAAKNRYDEGAFLTSLGNAYAALGETRRAVALYEQYLAIAREIGDRRGEGTVLGNLGLAFAALGETRRAVELYEQALVIAREISDRREEGADLDNLGNAYAALGETRRAVELYEQALVIAREIGDRRGERAALGSLGLAYAALGQTRRAVEYHEQALVIAREIGDRRGEGNALGNLGLAYAALGETHRAVALYEQYLAIAREIGDRSGEAIASWNLGDEYAKQGNLARAVANMQICVAYYEELGHPDAAKRAQHVAELRRAAAE